MVEPPLCVALWVCRTFVLWLPVSGVSFVLLSVATSAMEQKTRCDLGLDLWALDVLLFLHLALLNWLLSRLCDLHVALPRVVFRDDDGPTWTMPSRWTLPRCRRLAVL